MSEHRDQPPATASPDVVGAEHGNVGFEAVAGIPWRDLHERILLYDRARDLEFELAGSGAVVWRAVVGGATLHDLLTEVGSMSGEDAGAIEQTRTFLDDLVEKGLLRRV
jgi:hypothetical protein